MESALTLGLGGSSSKFFNLTTTTSTTPLLPLSLRPNISSPSDLHFAILKNPSFSRIRVRASSSSPSPVDGDSFQNPILNKIKTAAGALILAAAAASAAGKFHQLPARAEGPIAVTEEKITTDDVQIQEQQEEDKFQEPATPLSEFLESNSEAVEALKSLLQRKLEDGEDEEALQILKKLVSAQPQQTEWKFLLARLLNELGKTQDARDVFEEILKVSPLSFEALFENALLMDRCGERNAVIRRLEDALKIAEDEKKAKEARDVRLIMAQIQFLQKNVDEALSSYEELAKEDPTDYRPYFCKGMIYSLLDKNNEAREEFAKYRELSPKKFDVEGYLQTPLSRMKLFGTNEDN